MKKRQPKKLAGEKISKMIALGMGFISLVFVTILFFANLFFGSGANLTLELLMLLLIPAFNLIGSYLLTRLFCFLYNSLQSKLR
jgi:uncharacterized membrane protein